jgi:hypothetical protein
LDRLGASAAQSNLGRVGLALTGGDFRQGEKAKQRQLSDLLDQEREIENRAGAVLSGFAPPQQEQAPQPTNQTQGLTLRPQDRQAPAGMLFDQSLDDFRPRTFEDSLNEEFGRGFNF